MAVRIKKLVGPAVVLSLAMLAANAIAQGGLSDMMFTVGTTTPDSHGRLWAYLLWQGTQPALLQGHVFAVYGKAGDPDSTNAYTRRAAVTLQTDPILIQVLLNRGLNVGDNLFTLEDQINQLFQNVMPPGSLTLAQKVSAIIRGSTDAPHYGNLVNLSRLHPGLSFCLGFAHAELIGAGNTTFEIREFDPVKGEDLSVVGRVTVTAGAPLVLPAPGPPVEVVNANPQGHLNLKLRWAMPDALRRVALLNYGFNVYRMTRSFAEANSYHLTPPPTATLLVLASGNPAVKQINRLPILTPKDYDAVSALDFVGDPRTFFTADDNDRFKTNGVPFNNGDQFYYFVTARDILGRDGFVSFGTLLTACDRMPPTVPSKLEAVNFYTNDAGGSHQWLQVRWQQNPNTNAEDITASYHIYRWTNINDIPTYAGNPAAYRIGTVPHLNGQTNNSYLDNGAGAPALGPDSGRTFWYTVRAADLGACGTNFSGNSPPVFGVLRDRAGPAAPGGQILFQCTRPAVNFSNIVQTPLPPNTYRLDCTRLDEGIVLAQFYLGSIAPANLLCQAPFAPGDTLASCDVFTTNAAALWCVVFDAKGQSAAAFYSDFTFSIHEYNFAAHTVASQTAQDPANNGGCVGHDPTGGGTTLIAPICVNLTPAAKTRELKVYRRVDGGPLTMVHQLEITNLNPVSVCDSAMPANPAEFCYYAQAFDLNGNPSPLVRIGTCLSVLGITKMPRPLLSPIDPQGTETNALMKLTWFCAPHGVERFKVFIAPADNSGDPNLSSPQLSTNISPLLQAAKVIINGATNSYNFAVYETPLIGPGFGSGGAQFSVPVTAALGKSYVVFVESCGAGGAVSDPGNAEEFLWNPVRPVQPQVPWPARGLPAVNTKFTLIASNLANSYVGVAIGTGPNNSITPYNGYQMINGFYGDPMIFVTTNLTAGTSLFPVVLYRQQLANTNYPAVSGDIVQVSPLMERIAYGATANGTVIYDPFVAFVGGGDLAVVPSKLFLLDTQPVIIGARYRYYLMRFKANGEPDQVFVTNEVDL